LGLRIDVANVYGASPPARSGARWSSHETG